MTKNTTSEQRLAVIDPAVLAHMLEHPARGRRWTVRELAAVLGCSSSLIGYLRTGERRWVDPELALRISEAVGCHISSLFALSLSTIIDNKESA